jgi:SAM-dependent methyltransferase
VPVTSIYDFPQAYDAVLSRPQGVVEAEVESIDRLLRQRGCAGGRVLEVACGSSAHGIPLAARGYRITGIDRSQAMLAEAKRRADEASVGIRLAHADWSGFDLETADFDAAVFMFETFPLISRLDHIVSHFDAVRRHLRDGGVYVVDVDSYGAGIRSASGVWGRRTVTYPGGSAEAWFEDHPGNWIEGTNSLVLHCRIHAGEEIHLTRDAWTIHKYTPWDLAVLSRALIGWRFDSVRSWRDLNTDISAEAHYFAVFEAS